MPFHERAKHWLASTLVCCDKTQQFCVKTTETFAYRMILAVVDWFKATSAHTVRRVIWLFWSDVKIWLVSLPAEIVPVAFEEGSLCARYCLRSSKNCRTISRINQWATDSNTLPVVLTLTPRTCKFLFSERMALIARFVMQTSAWISLTFLKQELDLSAAWIDLWCKVSKC